MYRYNTIQIDQ